MPLVVFLYLLTIVLLFKHTVVQVFFSKSLLAHYKTAPGSNNGSWFNDWETAPFLVDAS